ncbi:MAG: hypothetical protein LBQ43_02430 [Holosporales bacterium]|jgi:hypothetical protein|nr:hypothetical protein [Holosporales bacterium]
MKRKITALCASLLVGLFHENGVCCLNKIEPLIKKAASTFMNLAKAGGGTYSFNEMLLEHPEINLCMFRIEEWKILSGIGREKFAKLDNVDWYHLSEQFLYNIYYFSMRILEWKERNPTRKICLVLGDDGLGKRSRFMNDFCVYWDKNVFMMGADAALLEQRFLRGPEGLPPALLEDATHLGSWRALAFLDDLKFDAIHDDFNTLGYDKSDDEKISLLNVAANVLPSGGTIGLRTDFFLEVKDLEKFLAEINNIYNVHEIPGDIESLCKVAPFGHINDHGNIIHFPYYSMIALIEGGLDKYNELSRNAKAAKGLESIDMTPEEFDIINEWAKRMERIEMKHLYTYVIANGDWAEYFKRFGIECTLPDDPLMQEEYMQKECIRKHRMAHGYAYTALKAPSDLSINKLAYKVNESLGYLFTPENILSVAEKSPFATADKIQKNLTLPYVAFQDSTRYVLIKR